MKSLQHFYPLIFLACGVGLSIIPLFASSASNEDKVSIRGNSNAAFGIAAALLIPGGVATGGGAIAPFSQVSIKSIDNSKGESEGEEDDGKPKG